MKTHWFRSLAGLCLLNACAGWLVWLHAQDAPEFTGIRRLTNNEIALTLNAPTGINYRIDTTTNLPGWEGLVTLPASSATSLQHTDSAAPYLDTQFYRAASLTGSNIVAGDHLVTTNGDVVIQPRSHATFVMQWNGRMIYSDPAPPATYTGLPKADLILITHHHSDHLSTTAIETVRTNTTQIICPLMVYSSLTASQKTVAIVLTNGAVTNVLEIGIEAVPAYNISNNNHPLGVGNGYVLTIGGKRIYIAGDTEDVPAMRALTDIDVAFVSINRPYTMAVSNAVSAVREFRPKVVYPYHFSPSTPTTDVNLFKRQVGTDLGIEVRLRKWY